jgi:predicted DNA-binding protein
MDTQALSFRLPKALYERLRRVAFELRMPMNTIVIEGVERRVAELEEDPETLQT